MGGISSDIIKTLKDRLKNSPYWNDKTTNTGKYINNITCPTCGKPEAFTYSTHPYSLYCHRGNKCGVSTKMKSLFPDVYTNIEKEYAPTPADPHLPAKCYLAMRGLQKSLEGLKYEYWPDIRKTGHGGVMFPVLIQDEKEVWNGRFFNPPQGEGKTHNVGSTRGLFWRHPGIKYDPNQEVFITEGIIDALSLIELGKQAVAVLAAGQDPKRVLISGFKHRVFAFDNDAAGHKALDKWLTQYPESKAVLPPEGSDWNDFIMSNQRDHFNDLRPEFEWFAKLAIAPTPNIYAEIYYDFKDYPPGLFEFNGVYYWSFIKETKDDVAIIVKNVSNFTVSVDHYQLDVSNKEEPSNRFYLRVKPKNGRPVMCSVTAADIYTPYKCTGTFMNSARVSWSGDQAATHALHKKISESKAAVVQQLYITGYDEITGCYFTNNFMIDKKGSTINKDRSGFFKVSPTTYIRPAPYTTIKPTPGGMTCPEIYDLMFQAWGENGLAAMAWMVGSWFVRQIKAKIGFYPFLSLYGDTQTGKTMLTRYLNALQCLDEEGLPMSKANTSKGEIRKIAQRSGLFKAMLEWPARGSARFDLSSILTMYNEAPLQVRAIKTNDLQTHELPFLSALMFVQNKEPFCTKAQKERVISLIFKKESINENSTKAFKKIITTQLSDFAMFFSCVMAHRQEIETKWHSVYEYCRKEMTEIEADARVVSNHALLMTFHLFLKKALNHDHDLFNFIEKTAATKHNSCQYVPETVADFFIDTVVQLQGDAEMKNVAVNFLDFNEDENIIWIHSAGAFKAVKDAGFVNVNPKDLYSELLNHPSYITNNIAHRFNDGIHKAWKLDATQIMGRME